MVTWIPLIMGIVGALPNLIQGVETAFGKKPKAGPEKWIGVETALSAPIQALATLIAKSAPNQDAQKISAAVSIFVKATNDAIVAFYNSVGWPSEGVTQ